MLELMQNRMKSSKTALQRNQKTMSELSEQELLARLLLIVTVIVLIGGGSVASFVFFGPQIGSFFGLISVNRNTTGPKDNLAPEPPIIYDFPVATKESTATLKGYAEPSATVKLFANGPEVQSTIADSTGQFTFADVVLIDGKNTLFAKAFDAAGNQSESSKVIYIDVDSKKPEITIISPRNGEVVRNLDKSVLVKGKLNKKGTLTINGRLAVVKPDLTFEILLGVNEGPVTIKLEATDTAGNVKTEKINITYERRGA